jgi:hypothetical protein
MSMHSTNDQAQILGDATELSKLAFTRSSTNSPPP